MSLKLLWFSWKDIKHPQAGGAERVTHELLKRTAAEGHKVVLITSRPSGSKAEELIDGYQVFRGGNRYTVYWCAWRRYLKKFRDWPDLVIDECNTIPFFAGFYTKKPVIMVFYQLCREIWFYQMLWPFSLVGYLLEPYYLRRLKKMKVITISQSTSNDLQRFGFRSENIKVISVGISMKLINTPLTVKKFPEPTLLYFGAIRPMKRALDVVKAYEYAKVDIPRLKLIIAGSDSGRYAKKVKITCKNSSFSQDIQLIGSVSEREKLELMQKAHLIAVTSVKEGWCLVVTEANSQGTPAVAYDVDGLRDSICTGETGLVTQEDPQALSRAILEIFADDTFYQKIQMQAWNWSKEINFERSYSDFKKVIEL